MSLIAVETIATVMPDGTVTLELPPSVTPGTHRVVIVVDAAAVSGPAGTTPSSDADLPAEGEEQAPFGIRVHDVGPWPEGLSLRREEMYGDWGR